jgi:hypothetical protein
VADTFQVLRESEKCPLRKVELFSETILDLIDGSSQIVMKNWEDG